MWMSVQCSTIRFGSNASCPVPQRRSFALGWRIGLARWPPRRALVCRQPVVLGVHNVVVIVRGLQRDSHFQVDGGQDSQPVRAVTAAWSRTRCGRWWTGPHAQHRRLRVATCLLSRGPPCPGRSGYNKRLRKLAHTIAWLIGVLGATPASATTICGWWTRPPSSVLARPRVKRSDLAGCAQCGYCASHSRYFWGLRLHLLCTSCTDYPSGGVDRGRSRRTRCADRDPLHHNYSRVQHQGIGDDHRRQETFAVEPSRHPVPGSLTNSRS